ncbi:MAG: hypothetical protein WDZ77_02810 [Candidatus Pacearchaeota archaeon]
MENDLNIIYFGTSNPYEARRIEINKIGTQEGYNPTDLQRDLELFDFDEDLGGRK